MELGPGDRILRDYYVPALREQIERDMAWLGLYSPPPLTRWQRMTRPFRRFGRRVSEVWNVVLHGADYYRDY